MAPILPAKTKSKRPPPEAPSPATDKGDAARPPAPDRGKKRKPPPPPPPEANQDPQSAAKTTSDATEAAGGNKTGQFQRTWPAADEVRILEALAAHRRAHGDLPAAAGLFAALDGRLERKGVGARDIADKQRSLRRRYDRDAKKPAPPADDHERRLYLLSRDVWGADSPPPPVALQNPPTAQDRGAGGGGAARAHATSAGEDAPAPKARTWAETRELYPYLVDEAMVLVDPAALERILPCVEDGQAQALDKKIKKMRNKLSRAIMESARMKDMEMPAVCLFSSTKLQPENLRAENGKTPLFHHLDKTDHMDICDQGRLARVEREIVELRQVLVASKSQEKIENIPCHDNLLVKGTRCESAESGRQSVVEENQIPSDMLQKEIGVPIPHRKDEEVTSNRFWALRCNTPKPQRAMKIDSKRSTPRTVVGRKVLLLSIIRPHAPVAKAILQAASRSATVGDMQFGIQCCKVFVYDVLQGEAPLLHQYGDMKNMHNALKRFIAWPREQIRDNTNASKAAP